MCIFFRFILFTAKKNCSKYFLAKSDFPKIILINRAFDWNKQYHAETEQEKRFQLIVLSQYFMITSTKKGNPKKTGASFYLYAKNVRGYTCSHYFFALTLIFKAKTPNQFKVMRSSGNKCVVKVEHVMIC